MSRIRWALLPAALVALLLAGQSAAAPPPWANAHPKRTTTTVAATTTSTTTTTLPATTTTVAPTTTIVAGCVPGTPITITAGGTYSGCYRSTDPAVPAVTLATSQPVTLDHARVEHTGKGVEDTVTGTQLTVLDTVFQQLVLSQVVNHRAIELEGVASFIAEHNQLTDGDGFWVSGGVLTTGPISVRFNNEVNIGRYPHPTNINCCVQFVQFDHVVTWPFEIAWNKMTNAPGQSDVEDNINFYFSGGTDSAHRSDVGHNLIDGAYDRSLSGDDTGGGINLGDAGAAHNFGHDNVIVSTTNYGIAVHQLDNYADSNLIVNDGAEQADPNGQAVLAFQNVSPVGVHATNTRYNFRRFASDPDQWPCYQSVYCSGGVQVGLSEQDARDEWEAARVAAGVTVGPRP
jgi:hypothetical protein